MLIDSGLAGSGLMKLRSVSATCIRGFLKQATIDLKPLTLLVGANSSGKSSLIRLFPLLRQSLETNTKGPLLWYGPYVDFGSFHEARSNDANDAESVIGFTFTLAQSPTFSGWLYHYPNRILDEVSISISISIEETSMPGSSFTRSITAVLDNEVVKIDFDENGIANSYSVNQEECLSPSLLLRLSQGLSFFTLESISKDAPKQKSPSQYEFDSFRRLIASNELLKHIDCLFHGNTIPETKLLFAQSLGVGTMAGLIKQILELPAAKTTKRNLGYYSKNKAWMKRLHGLVIANKLPFILSEVDKFLSATLKHVSYMGPLRATASRYYRQQDLATDEVDPEGANMAMFLSSLSVEEQDSFSSWCHKQMGFKVKVRPSSSHVSIEIEDTSDGKVYNIADMGFGYSQVLPVLAVIWNSQREQSSRKLNTAYLPGSPFWGSQYSIDHILPIEQPELHLHPRLQARLADLYCKIAADSSTNNSGVRFIIETHSETIVNRVGEMIYRNVIGPDDVQVLIVSKDEEGSHIKAISYDSSGNLEQWPYGFFLPDED